jgi:hypothetical protein
MAKGQKRSTRETRKPKQVTAKPAPPPRSFLESAAPPSSQGPRR